MDILVLTILGTLCGCEGWIEIELYGQEKHGWLRKFLELANGIPSHDTIRRVFLRLKPEELHRCFLSWVEALRVATSGEIVSIDGKTLRRSGDRQKGLAPLHLVSAWSHENRLVLGQVKTEAGSNEITAIPELVELLELKGCILTIDATATSVKRSPGSCRNSAVGRTCKVSACDKSKNHRREKKYTKTLLPVQHPGRFTALRPGSPVALGYRELGPLGA